MAKKKQTKLTATQKKQLSKILGIVRRFPRKKKTAPAVTGVATGAGSKGSVCIFKANSIKAAAAKQKALVTKGLKTPAEIAQFNAQATLVSQLLTDFAASGCDQTLIAGI